VQVDPVKPTLKAPGTQRLKVECDETLSSFAFNFNLRRYNMEAIVARGKVPIVVGGTGLYLRWLTCGRQGLTLLHFSAQRERFLCDRGGS